jgi:hypothetical protein
MIQCRDLLIAVVLAQEAQSQSSVGVMPIVVAVVSARSHSNAAQTFHVWSPKCLRPDGGLRPGVAEWSFLREVACRRNVGGRAQYACCPNWPTRRPSR